MFEVVSLDDELIADIRACQETAAKVISVALTDDPKHIVTEMTAWTRARKDAEEIPDDDTIVALGTLLAEQYVRQYGWRWGEIIWDEDDSTHAVLTPDNSLYINAIWWVSEVFKNRDSTNFLLNFNMVAAGNVPQAAPGALMGFH